MFTILSLVMRIKKMERPASEIIEPRFLGPGEG
jgi:hypothetical protein